MPRRPPNSIMMMTIVTARNAATAMKARYSLRPLSWLSWTFSTFAMTDAPSERHCTRKPNIPQTGKCESSPLPPAAGHSRWPCHHAVLSGHRIREGHGVVAAPILGGLHHEYRLEP